MHDIFNMFYYMDDIHFRVEHVLNDQMITYLTSDSTNIKRGCPDSLFQLVISLGMLFVYMDSILMFQIFLDLNFKFTFNQIHFEFNNHFRPKDHCLHKYT